MRWYQVPTSDRDKKPQGLFRALLLCLLLLGAASGCSPRASQTDSAAPESGTGTPTGSAISSRKDFQKLVDILVPFAKKMLEKSGKFDPFAAAIDTSGEPSVLSAGTDEGEQHDSAKLLALLARGLDQGRADGQLRATGVCFPVTAIPGSTTKIN